MNNLGISNKITNALVIRCPLYSSVVGCLLVPLLLGTISVPWWDMPLLLPVLPPKELRYRRDCFYRQSFGTYLMATIFVISLYFPWACVVFSRVCFLMYNHYTLSRGQCSFSILASNHHRSLSATIALLVHYSFRNIH